MSTPHPGKESFYTFTGGEVPAVFELIESVEAYAGTVCLWIRRETATT